ncbi:asparagine synthase (glutamine-hydrolyzing) [Saccharococcus caldoxylosilyticus]|uniref:asparagine synthase (glutamine-hydrolyzing) n=1 Tax=Parageobacillus caldoxylosilyticus NBRC 107762 TaxID=1220594 RepID=A0A023DAH2_9BACL|nr:asparagine synthase (glutamine-hydrolyzing) [Parageobacillus caldoxylosilyticus]MBB3851075.1 asparagine synthase (glutamine-hydrolyzing) [Parageobacillus caldoxylosilyticus]GAJ38355.1 asparagine synthetase [Parageobacillus caldoxylosilyticus NBRC 107762]
MCGLVGFIVKQSSNIDYETVIKQMSMTLSHRGPDDFGIWVDPNVGISLGHRRLSIIDLSPEGHQPMHSISNRYVVVFNGEIYNHQDIRNELLSQDPQITFRGRSDTEVMLAAFEKWGVKKAVEKFVGMFAFALWDKKERVLYLCRDRMGEKPLYYGWVGDTFMFASELKALTKHPNFKQEVNRDALALYMRYSYIPSPYSIYKNIFKLQPGTLLTVDVEKNLENIEYYWSLKNVIEVAKNEPFQGSETEAIEHLHSLIIHSVKQQMLSSDVPVGAFLSGGIDSSTVVAIMQAQSKKAIKTFSIGFYEQDYNEAQHAKAVADYLGTDHTELYVTPQEAIDVIPLLPSLYDEPLSDPSQIPTYLVAKLARKHVTVSLSGDGGDELFGGYSRYIQGKHIWKKIRNINWRYRNLLANTIFHYSEQHWDYLLSNKIVNRLTKNKLYGSRIYSVAMLLKSRSFENFYRTMVSHWKIPSELVKGSQEFNDNSENGNGRFHVEMDDFEKMMYIDSISYLPDDILVKVDRASMGVSLESRIPLLDHRIVEFAWKLPIQYKVNNGIQKWILRQILYKYVPQQLIERPKMGFGVPIGHWLRGPLREWAEELLDEERLKVEGFFNPSLVRKKWIEHLKGEKNWQYYLWDVLMFQAWLNYSK